MKGLWIGLVATGPLALTLWLVASAFPGLVETFYSRGLYPSLMAPWSRLWSSVPFAVTPWVVIALGAGVVALFFALGARQGLAWTAAAVSVLVAWFLLGWSLNVHRPAWADLHGLELRPSTLERLEALGSRLAQGASGLRAQVRAPLTEAEIDRLVSEAYRRWGEGDPLVAGDWGTVKSGPALLSWLGISGIFPPFFGEALVNPGPPIWQRPFTAAHELAHLRGFCREDEANFLAFAALRDDPHPALAYAAWSSALLYVASALTAVGPEGAEAWNRVRSQVSRQVADDWQATWAYWDRFRGPAQVASEAINDLYLRSQGASDGVRSYGRMVDLLLASETAAGPEPR